MMVFTSKRGGWDPRWATGCTKRSLAHVPELKITCTYKERAKTADSAHRSLVRKLSHYAAASEIGDSKTRGMAYLVRIRGRETVPKRWRCCADRIVAWAEHGRSQDPADVRRQKETIERPARQ